ncbi:protein kinase domain-containing protein [Aurantivibrio plasticivorans]
MASMINITRIFSLRVAVIVLALLLVLPMARPGWLLVLDQWLFNAGEILRKVDVQPLPIAVVSLSSAEAEAFTHNPGSLHDVYTMLNRLLARNDTRIAIIVDGGVKSASVLEQAVSEVELVEPEITPQNSSNIEKPSSNLASENLSVGESQQDTTISAEETLRRYQKAAPHIRRLLDLNRVIVWDSQSNSVSATRNDFEISLSESTASRYFNSLPNFLRPQLHSIDEPPFSTDKNRTVHLLTTSEMSQIEAGLPLAVLGHFENQYQYRWNQQAIHFSDFNINTSSMAEVIPANVAFLYAAKTVEETLEQLPQERLIIVSALSEFQNEALLSTLSSLRQQTHVYKPYWFDSFEVILLSLLSILLIVSFPKLSNGAKVLAVCLIVTLLVVAQLGWQVTQQQWLPMGIIMQFVLLAAILLSVAQSQQSRELQLIAAAHGARYQLGLQLYRDGRNDDALLAIKECHASEAVLSLMYDIAAQQERKRHYAEAVKTYQSIVERQENFKDAKQKVEKLMAFSSGGAASFHDTGDIAKTLIISESTINKPVLGRYEIERELGRGAMGVVYLGRDPKISRQVAIKTLSYAQLDSKELEEFKSRFFREAEAAGRLSHPNIITVYDVGEEHDLAFIAMDYVDGKSLASYVHEDHLLSLADVCELIAQVADALAYAHQHQIIHRDIKPGNIMYQVSHRIAKVADFGVARIVDSAKTNTGDILGSPLYMSPEQLQGAKVSFQTDIYSLGVTLYQLLTGKLPFSAENLATLTYNIINEKHKGVRDIRPELPKGFTRIINRAMNKDPDKRFSTAEEFAVALRKLSKDEL